VVGGEFGAQEIKTQAWARYYSKRGVGFALSVAPRIRSFYESTYGDHVNRSLLDVCCGQGNLAGHFLDHGYRVIGIDLSEPMLEFARENLRDHLRAGRVELIRADATDFSVSERFGLATSTFDALNMLQSIEQLKSCFQRVKSSLVEDGMFVFDLMTRRGFWRDYNGVWVVDTQDELFVHKSVYDGAEKATTRMTGFVRRHDGAWDRFEEFRTPTFFHAQAVVRALKEAGWLRVWVAGPDDLARPAEDPEALERVFFVATGPNVHALPSLG
jgi:SAM-dependent methyltransferase